MSQGTDEGIRGRARLAAEVARRTRHETPEHVRITCSFARAERLLEREYHGRFVIELLQNATDAWRADPRSAEDSMRLAVLITEGPALLVANQGAPMTVQAVIESLGHIGASTKTEGEAIGHKGIGFKSVLEVTLTPEIYSGLHEPAPELAVAFDPIRALSDIQSNSIVWTESMRGMLGIDPTDETASIPVLRFPAWVDDLPDEVKRLAREGFDTVIRLPFDARFERRLGLDADAWLATVRAALSDISDQTLLLLGCLGEIRVEDRLESAATTIRPEREDDATSHEPDGSLETIRVLRNDAVSTRWRLFRRKLPDLTHLTGEIAVGIRLSVEPGPDLSARVLHAVDGTDSSPFHLFFPTRIASGLPFLLHGYFEVNAARTNFYHGSASRNQHILHEIAALAADAVSDVASDTTIDLVSLVNGIAIAGEPEEPLARAFRAEFLSRLDSVAWVPLRLDDGGQRSELPERVFVADRHLAKGVADAFPPAYVRARLDLGLPDPRLASQTLELIAMRQSDAVPGLWNALSDLLRPGVTRVWREGAEDEGFLALLELIRALEVPHPSMTEKLIQGLRADPNSRLLPTVGPAGLRVLLPIPDPAEGAPGRRSKLVMARARATTGAALVPPPELDLAFLPDGLLGSEADVERARPLGVRPFTVDNILDRLSGMDSSVVGAPAAEGLLRFLWQLLVRERVSPYGTLKCADRALEFDPSAWFWCQPGRARIDDSARLGQQRERYLAMVPLPCRDGRWRTAGSLCFGEDWAEWLEAGHGGRTDSEAMRQRRDAYRALEAVSPGDHVLLASPEIILDILGDDAFGSNAGVGDDDYEPVEALGEVQRHAQRHAFLLRLGVWEVPPIEAFESRDTRNRDKFPWVGPLVERQAAQISAHGGWQFGREGWSGRRHQNVYLAEDYRFVWPLADAAAKDVDALVTGIRLGAALYSQRETALVFCPACVDSHGSHRATRHGHRSDNYPSLLALALRHEPWIPCTLDGRPCNTPIPAEFAWWHSKPPTGGGLHSSPWRYVPLCGPPTGITRDLAILARVNTIDGADAATVTVLLHGLRSQFEHVDGKALPVEPSTSGTARQAFIALHRLAYERLAELATGSAGTVDIGTVLEPLGVLCELGDGLVYRPLAETRHDNGLFAAYVRYFVSAVPLVVLERHKGAVARQLGIRRLEVRLARRGHQEGRDVTEDVRDMLGDRIGELLAIVVHHSLGSQTLELASLQFEERARRLMSLRIRQLDDLIVDATVEGSAHRVTIGERSDQDLFLEAPTSSAPVLYHDFNGDDWPDRLRRKIAPHLAVVLENPAYADTFAVFLQQETDAEREEFLLERGVTSDEVSAVAAAIGVVDKEERRRHRRWFTAIVRTLRNEADRRGPDSAAKWLDRPTADQAPQLELDPDTLVGDLRAAGLDDLVAHRLVEAGGSADVRRDTGEGRPLRLLFSAGVELHALDACLRSMGDDGLTINVARRMFSDWCNANWGRLVAVLARSDTGRYEGTDALYQLKKRVRSLGPASEHALAIDPLLASFLTPVADVLREHGVHADQAALATHPAEALAHLGGFASVDALDAEVSLLLDEEEQDRLYRERAAQWRRELRLLAVLARTGAQDTRAAIRMYDEQIAEILPRSPARPSDLVIAVESAFDRHPNLAASLRDRLDDSLTRGGPIRAELLELAHLHGVAVDRVAVVERALDAPRRVRATDLRRRAAKLAQQQVKPMPPPGLLAPPPRTPVPRVLDKDGSRPEPKPVPAIKVDSSLDKRKRQLGDDAEQWVLAAIVQEMVDLDPETRGAVVDQMKTRLKELFTGRIVDAVQVQADLVRSMGDDEEDDLIDALVGLLHVSTHSDAFSFDMLGWLPPSAGAEPQVMLIEVKSSGGEAFHLSQGEWSLANQLHVNDRGDQFAVLVVRRGTAGGSPTCMDLLVDPVYLVNSQQMQKVDDGYRITYQVDRR